MFIKCFILYSHPVRWVPLLLPLSQEETLVHQERTNKVLTSSTGKSDGEEGRFRSGRYGALEPAGLSVVAWCEGRGDVGRES